MCKSTTVEGLADQCKILSEAPPIESQLTIVQTLSFVWFALCTSLVVKDNDLVAVFFSFTASFLIAVTILGRDIRSENFTTKERLENKATKLNVGIILCVLSLLLLTFNEKREIMGFSLIKKTSEFHAMANIAGYLAFDLWFDCMCCRQFPPCLRNTLEDVATLSIFCTILAKWDDLDMSSSQYTTPSIVIWVGYKIFRCTVECSGDNGVKESVNNNHDMKNSSTVSKHNLWTIHGKDYILEDFVESHPGGKEAILLGRGRDCTALFESYHPFTNRHRHVLKKFKAEDSDKLSQTNSEEKDEFYTVMKERAKKALQEKGIDPNTDRAATIGRALYYFIIIGLLILSGSFHIKSNPIGSFFFAVFGWLVGCLGHDAGHFAASRIPFFNDAGVWGISFLCNPIMWQHQHTFAHHSHTNDFDKDPDLHHFSILLRVHRKFQHDPIYKNQNNLLYVILAYALVVFGECIKIPIGMMKTGFLYDIVEYTDQRRPLRALGMYLHYVGYIALIMVAPFLSANSYWTAFSCGIVHIITAGWLFAVFSQVNHLNEFSIETDRGKTKNKLLKESWAAQQVATSNNFATKSLFWHIFSNGLNMQIEHHLFPGLNHCHLHIIQPTVQKTCEEYGVHYKSFESWSEVMGATLEWLDKLSTPI